MSVAFKHPRGTRAALNTLAAANGLIPYQVYLLSDEGYRPVVATAVNTFADVALKNDLGTAAAKNISVGTVAPASPAAGDLWVDTN